MECSAIGTFADNRTGTFLYLKRILGNMLFLEIVSCCRLLRLPLASIHRRNISSEE